MCGDTTSARPRTRSGCTSGTCGVRPRPTASRACCTPYAGSGTSSETEGSVPLRRRVGLAAAAAVGIAIVLACCVTYFVVRGQLVGQVDSALQAQATVIARGDFGSLDQSLPAIPPSAGGPAPYVQAVAAHRTVIPRQGWVKLPINRQVLALAANGGRAHLNYLHPALSHL